MHNIKKIKENITELAALGESEWDAICAGCGVCCLHKIDVDGTVYFSKFACNHCDLKTKACKKFADRLANGACVKIKLHDVIAGKYLPDNCAYVERVFGPATIAPDINWNDIKQNPTSMARVEKNLIAGSDTWASHTESDMIPELLEFIKKFDL